jgi:uncharacterized protein (PEP-CTERM system associated)
VTAGQAGSYITSLIGLRVDYELWRNLVLSGKAGYEWDDYSALSRHDRFLKLGTSATYYLNRNFQLSVDYRYVQRDSNVTAVDYNRNVYGVSLRSQF